MAESKYYIKDAILKPAAHHASFKALWETKWKAPVRMNKPHLSTPLTMSLAVQDGRLPFHVWQHC